MNRALRRSAWFGAGILVALLVAVLVIGSLTRTDWGRARILAFTVKTLGGQLNGTLVVDRLEGNVITGARLYDLAIRDLEGEPLIVADSAYIDYEVPTFLGGDVVINRLVVYSAELFLRRLPTDTLWNYQRVLQDTTEAPGPGRATLIERLLVEGAQVTVRLPWEPDEGLTEREREREIEVALADTSRLVVDRVPGGLIRTMLFEIDAAELAEVMIAPDERGGTYLRVEHAEGLVHLYQDIPLRVAGLQGELALREGVTRYEAPRIVLPASELASVGLVDATGEEPRYDLLFQGDRVALSDLQWLYPPIPDQGAVGGRLWLETRPEGLLFLARDMQLAAPGTRIAGDFGLVVGDTLRFLEVELVAKPLKVETVEQMLPAGLPVEGLRIGSVVIGSPPAS